MSEVHAVICCEEFACFGLFFIHHFGGGDSSTQIILELNCFMINFGFSEIET